VTFGAGIGRGVRRLFDACIDRVLRLGDLHFDLHHVWTGVVITGARAAVNRLQQGRDVGEREPMVDVHVPQRIERHGGKRRLVGILHDSDTAELLDGPQPGCAIVEVAGQDDPRFCRGRACTSPPRRCNASAASIH
jgi:hypothetical protein